MTSRIITYLIIFQTFFFLNSCGSNITVNDFPPRFKSGEYELSIEHGGITRTFLLHLPPAYDGKSELPMVIFFHGGGGNYTNAVKMAEMDKKADKEGFILLAPNGTGRFKDKFLTWNTGNCCGYALNNNTDDAGFIRKLLDTLQKTIKINSKQIFATGISNGGMMSYLVGCKISDKIAAIAPVAGALNFDCYPSAPISVIIFHGTDDQSVLYEGGTPRKQADKHERTDKSVSYSVDFWVKNNGCDTIPVKEEKGNIIIETYGNGKNNTEVVLYTIIGGTHSWPGGNRLSIILDKPTQEISANDLMWEFFKKHGK